MIKKLFGFYNHDLKLENDRLRQHNEALRAMIGQLRYKPPPLDSLYGLGGLSGAVSTSTPESKELNRLKEHNKKLVKRLAYYEQKPSK